MIRKSKDGTASVRPARTGKEDAVIQGASAWSSGPTRADVDFARRKSVRPTPAAHATLALLEAGESVCQTLL